jgi:hypothetical protein
MTSKQGDQIGRIFAFWVIVYFGQFLENNKRSPNDWTTFSHGKRYSSIVTKDGFGYILGYFLGYILGAFFTSSSGHPACRQLVLLLKRLETPIRFKAAIN